MRGRVEQGRSGGGNSYSYDVLGSGQSDQSGERRIKQNEAQAIGRVFILYRDGVAPREIAKTLNRESVPGPARGT